MDTVTASSIRRAKVVVAVLVLGDHVAVQWGQIVNGTENALTQIVVQVVQEVQGGVNPRQFHPSIDFLLPIIDPPRHHTMVSKHIA